MGERYAAWVTQLAAVNADLARSALLGLALVVVFEGVRCWPMAAPALARLRGGLFALAYTSFLALLAGQLLALVGAIGPGR